MKRIILIMIVALMLPNAIAAQSQYNYLQLPDSRQEQAAKELMDTIRCVVCQGQSIADSNADLAADMRGMIRERIAKGEKPEAIRAWLIEHYGEWVSFKPVVDGNSAPLWLVPLLALITGIFLVRGRFKKRVS